jgi:hypothetical protein
MNRTCSGRDGEGTDVDANRKTWRQENGQWTENVVRDWMSICRYRLLSPVRANGHVRGMLQPFLYLTGNLFLCGGFFGE